MNLFTRNYIIKVSYSTAAKAIELILVILVILFQFMIYDNIELREYDFKDGAVSTRQEDFVVRNNYLTLSFGRADIEQDLIDGKPLLVKVVGFNVFDGIIKRRIINGKRIE